MEQITSAILTYIGDQLGRNVIILPSTYIRQGASPLSYHVSKRHGLWCKLTYGKSIVHDAAIGQKAPRAAEQPYGEHSGMSHRATCTAAAVVQVVPYPTMCLTTLFVTSTANPKWEEVLSTPSPTDPTLWRPFSISSGKLTFAPGALAQWVVEYQKRGLSSGAHAFSWVTPTSYGCTQRTVR